MAIDVRDLQRDLVGYWNQVVIDLTKSLTNAYPGSSGRTRQSIGSLNAMPVELSVDGVFIRIWMPPYYDFMDKGVRGARNKAINSPYSYKDKGRGPKGGQKGMPPISAMRRFMLNRGIVGQNYRKIRSTKNKNTRKKAVDNELNKIAYAIAYKIWKNGLRGTKWYSRVINDARVRQFEEFVTDKYGQLVLEVFSE